MKNKNFSKYLNDNYDKKIVESFHDLSFAMKWGVFLKFFDSVGIIITTPPKFNLFKPATFGYKICLSDGRVMKKLNFKTRQQAQIQAITKAFELCTTN